MRGLTYVVALAALAALSSGRTPTGPAAYRVVWRQPGQVYYMRLPAGYQRQFASGGEAERENEFVYPDSAAVYVTNFAGSSALNYPNLARLGPAVVARRFPSQLLAPQPPSDTLVLQGRTPTGRYWKDVRVGELSIGYANVSAGRRACFEAALGSFRKKITSQLRP